MMTRMVTPLPVMRVFPRFAGDIRVVTEPDAGIQEDRIQRLLAVDPQTGYPRYLSARRSVESWFKSIPIGEVKALFQTLKALFPADRERNVATLEVGHNLKTATINYHENAALRVALHSKLAALGVDFIDSDGEALEPSVRFQLHDQYRMKFGLPLDALSWKSLRPKN